MYLYMYNPHGWPRSCPPTLTLAERIFIGLITSDRILKASRQGSK